MDRLFGIVVSTSDCHPRCPGFDSRYTLEIFLEVQGLERGPTSLVRIIGQLLDMISSEIRLRKRKLRLRDKRFANHKAPCTAIQQQPLQLVLALRGCSATDLFCYFIINGLYADTKRKTEKRPEAGRVKNAEFAVKDLLLGRTL